jgi:hypothetical protein
MLPFVDWLTDDQRTPSQRGLRRQPVPDTIRSVNFNGPNSHLPACWLHMLVCPRRYLAVLPSQVRPSLFGSD